jgi:hypothetical protein
VPRDFWLAPEEGWNVEAVRIGFARRRSRRHRRLNPTGKDGSLISQRANLDSGDAAEAAAGTGADCGVVLPAGGAEPPLPLVSRYRGAAERGVSQHPEREHIGVEDCFGFAPLVGVDLAEADDGAQRRYIKTLPLASA